MMRQATTPNTMMDDVRRQALGVHATQDRRDLPVLAQRVGEPRHPDEPRVGGDDEDGGREEADPGPEDAAQPGQVVGHEPHDSLHRVLDEVAAQLGAVHRGVLTPSRSVTSPVGFVSAAGMSVRPSMVSTGR